MSTNALIEFRYSDGPPITRFYIHSNASRKMIQEALTKHIEATKQSRLIERGGPDLQSIVTRMVRDLIDVSGFKSRIWNTNGDFKQRSVVYAYTVQASPDWDSSDPSKYDDHLIVTSFDSRDNVEFTCPLSKLADFNDENEEEMP